MLEKAVLESEETLLAGDLNVNYLEEAHQKDIKETLRINSLEKTIKHSNGCKLKISALGNHIWRAYSHTVYVNFYLSIYYSSDFLFIYFSNFYIIVFMTYKFL